MSNPDARIAKSQGIDRPIMYVYLAGRIAGNCMEKCTSWRRKIRDHYNNYKKIVEPCKTCSTDKFRIFNKPKDCPVCAGAKNITQYEAYPISFLDPLNSGESKTADALGLTSHLPANLIYHKDLLSVERADVIVANVEDYFEAGIEELMGIPNTVFDMVPESYITNEGFDYRQAFFTLQDKIKNRRENFGTICEIAWALYLNKPLILIVPEARQDIYRKHPFATRASVIVTSVDELLESKWLQNLYKSIASSIY